MTIENLGVKLYSGTKSDRKSDSLGSSADGSNTGIILLPVKDYAVFDGTNDYISFSTKFDQMQQAGSFSVWLKPDTTDNSEVIFDNAGSSSLKKGFTILFKTGNVVKYGIWDGDDSTSAGGSISSTGVWTTGEWQHLCVTYNGTTAKIYRNAVEVATGSLTATSSTASYNASLGRDGQDEDDRYDGGMYQALVYSDALTPTEVTTLYNSGTPVTSPSTSGLVSRYDLTANANDSQGSNNGTNTGVTFSTDNYKLGTGAYDFTSGQVDIGKTTQTGDFSVTFWFNADSNSGVQRLWHNNNNSSKLEIQWYNSQVAYTVKDATGNNGSSLNTGTWYHVALTREGSAVKLYIDGVLKSSTTEDEALSNADNATIGGSGSSENYNGKIDDVSNWSRALTATEIGKLVNNNGEENYLSQSSTGQKQLDESANKYGINLASNNPLIGKTLKSITFSMKKNNSPTGNVSAKIYKNDSTSATATSSTTLDVSTLTTSFVDKTFEFASGVTLASGDRIVVEGGSHDGTNQIMFEQNSSSFTDTVTIARYTSSWVDGISGDFLYKLTSTNADAQSVSSLTNKSGLKAHYSMDTETTVTADGTSQTTANSQIQVQNTNSSEDRILGYQVTTGSPFVGKTITGFKIKLRNTFNASGTFAITGGIWSTSESDPMTTIGRATSPTSVTFDQLETGTTWSANSDTSGSDVVTYNLSSPYTIQSGDLIGVRPAGGTFNSSSVVVNGNSSSVDGNAKMKGYRTSWFDYSAWDMWLVVITSTDKCPNDFSSTSDLEALTGVRTNSIFQQTDDTPSYWWYNGTSWVLDGTTLAIDEDFSINNFTSNDTNVTNVVDGALTYWGAGQNTYGDGAYYKTPVTLDDNKWVMRARYEIEAWASPSGDSYQVFIGMIKFTTAANAQGVSSSYNQDGISFGHRIGTGTNGIRIGASNVGGQLYNNIETLTGLTGTRTCWIELTRLSSTTSKLEIFSDEGFTNSIGVTPTLTHGAVTGLDTIMINSQQGNGTGGANHGNIDNLQIQNGTSEWLE